MDTLLALVPLSPVGKTIPRFDRRYHRRITRFVNPSSMIRSPPSFTMRGREKFGSPDLKVRGAYTFDLLPVCLWCVCVSPCTIRTFRGRTYFLHLLCLV